ncbi:MAG: bile acid:sodium symporter family protein [Planctomycetota bacterium]
MFQGLLLVWLLLVSALSLFWPELVGTARFDPFTACKPLIPWMITCTMFAVGVMLPREEVRQLRERWPHVLFGTLIQYTTMPLLAWAAAYLFRLPEDYRIGMILVGCVPGAMASNVITMNARGHTSYSVGLTTSATMLSPIIVPLTLWLALGTGIGSSKDWDFIAVGVNLFKQVVAPVLAGYLLTRLWPPAERVGGVIGPPLANLFILAIIATVVALNRERMMIGTLTVALPLLAVNLLGYASGYAAGSAIGQPESMRRALAIEVGMQNAGLGTSLAIQLFPDHPAATVPTALYTFGCVLTGMILAAIWAHRLPTS